jgi:hypothetical protein
MPAIGLVETAPCRRVSSSQAPGPMRHAARRQARQRRRRGLLPGSRRADARIAPVAPRRRHAQKIASCVEAGPGSRFVVATPSSNSSASSHWRLSTHRRRRSAMWAGGPPKPVQPRRSHSYAMVASDTRSCNAEVRSGTPRSLWGRSSGVALTLQTVQSYRHVGLSYAPARRNVPASPA